MLLDQVKTYSWDLPLFTALGLEPFDIPCQEKYHCGRVILNNAIVNIWVEGLPAQFWEFKIEGELRNYHVTTGSGSLKDFWGVIVMLAQDMLVVEKGIEKGGQKCNQRTLG